jgi:nucleoside-diphosphate-sugar epimerase
MATSGCTVLLLGGTGRTGGRVLRQLLDRSVRVRAVVRSAARLPEGVADHAALEVVEADLLALSDDEFARLVEGCDAAVSCLGHTIDARGVFGRPRDLVTDAVTRVYRAAREAERERPLRLILMSTVSVNRPSKADRRRGWFERLCLWLLRGLVPPARDNQDAADFLLEVAGADGRAVQWTAVRPDSLKEGDVSPYDVHEGLVDSLFRPGQTRMSNVADFMCELVTDDDVWERWQGKLPVVVDRV